MRLFKLLVRWVFNFPRHRMAHKGGWREINLQLAKMGEELSECIEAASRRDARHLTMEIMDVIHAAETALIVVNGPDEGYLSSVKADVIRKNEERGYYDGNY